MFMPSALSHIVDRVARQTVGKDWNIYAALLEHWTEIVGQQYAETTTPVKMTFPHQPNEARRCAGTLYIRLPKGLAMEFTFRAEQIRQRVNGYFGYEAVAKIALDPIYGAHPAAVTAPKPVNPAAVEEIKQAADTVENDELKQALESFGLAVLRGPDTRR